MPRFWQSCSKQQPWPTRIAIGLRLSSGRCRRSCAMRTSGSETSNARRRDAWRRKPLLRNYKQSSMLKRRTTSRACRPNSRRLGSGRLKRVEGSRRETEADERVARAEAEADERIARAGAETDGVFARLK